MRSDDSPRPADIIEALGLLTRLPVALAHPRGAAAAWAWPLAGALAGVLAGLVGWLGIALGLTAGPAAVLALAAMVMLTGAMHEDGLADCADGFWGGRTREERLAIMKDSRIGAYGVLALVLVVLARWQALTQGSGAGMVAALVASAAIGRASMAVLLRLLPNARGSGLAALVGRPPASTAWLAVAAGLTLAAIAAGRSAVPAILAAGCAALIVATIARARIGGQTGDVLGAAGLLAETAALLVLLGGD